MRPPQGHLADPLLCPVPKLAASTPSTIYLLILDLVIAFIQLILIVVAFAEPVSNLPASFQGDAPPPRDYSALLGDDWDRSSADEDDLEERNADEPVSLDGLIADDQDDDDEDDDDRDDRPFQTGSSSCKNFSIPTASARLPY